MFSGSSREELKDTLLGMPAATGSNPDVGSTLMSQPPSESTGSILNSHALIGGFGVQYSGNVFDEFFSDIFSDAPSLDITLATLPPATENRSIPLPKEIENLFSPLNGTVPSVPSASQSSGGDMARELEHYGIIPLTAVAATCSLSNAYRVLVLFRVS
jgi:hypothetical protein